MRVCRLIIRPSLLPVFVAAICMAGACRSDSQMDQLVGEWKLHAVSPRITAEQLTPYQRLSKDLEMIHDMGVLTLRKDGTYELDSPFAHLISRPYSEPRFGGEPAFYTHTSWTGGIGRITFGSWRAEDGSVILETTMPDDVDSINFLNSGDRVRVLTWDSKADTITDPMNEIPNLSFEWHRIPPGTQRW